MWDIRKRKPIRIKFRNYYNNYYYFMLLIIFFIFTSVKDVFYVKQFTIYSIPVKKPPNYNVILEKSKE